MDDVKVIFDISAIDSGEAAMVLKAVVAEAETTGFLMPAHITTEKEGPSSYKLIDLRLDGEDFDRLKKFLPESFALAAESAKDVALLQKSPNKLGFLDRLFHTGPSITNHEGTKKYAYAVHEHTCTVGGHHASVTARLQFYRPS